ncbi:MAG: aldehyde dehydrogenase EutE [Chloroflexi bacterium]|nr:aldehyde dehydrogenase EutE [Chloroflexota bacterium]
MEIDRTRVASIVEEVVKKFVRSSALETLELQSPKLGIYQDLDSAVDAAKAAHETLSALSLEKRKELVQAMREAALSHAQELADLGVAETGMGRASDKLQKNILAAQKTPGVEDLDSVVFTGDRGLTLVEMAPYGVIGSITPSTNPAATVINNSIGMVSAGNAVVFHPHPTAAQVSNRAVEIINEGIMKAGGPPNLLTSLAKPTLQSGQYIMKHPGIRILVVTGGEEVVHLAMRSGKKVIAAGPGNPPVVVDETADIKKAASDIIFGASFDNNVLCTAEKILIVVESVINELRRFMKISGAYELTSHQVEELVRVVVKPGGPGCSASMNKDYIGRTAQVLAKAIGLDLPSDIRLLFCEVSEDHPLVQLEQLMPVLPMVRVRDVNEAIDMAVRVEHGNYHSAMMHSKNVESLSRMAQRIKTSIFVKNGPSVAGLGYGGEGYTTLTIASPTGEGLTSARSFTRSRRCVLVDYFRII